MAITGTQSMAFNAASRRTRTTRQQEFIDRKIDALYIQTDLARLSFVNNSGANWPDIPYTTANGGSGFTNVYTNSTGNRYPVGSTLSAMGSKWRITDNNTSLTYNGNSGIVQFYGSTVTRPNQTNNSVNTINITNPGSGYFTEPTVTITGDGTDATAVAAINITTGEVTDIIVTNGGSGYTTATVTLTGGGGTNATAVAVLSTATVLSLSIYKNGSPIDSLTNASVIGDPNNVYTSNQEISVFGTIKSGDKITLVIQNESTRNLSYNLYSAILAVRPIEMVGN